VRLIGRDELKAKLDRGDDVKLVMVLGDRAFRIKHIPGSINIFAPQLPSPLLDRDDDIVVYCTNPSCIASIYAHDLLTARGFKRVRRYAGGVEEWEGAGYPTEGELGSSSTPIRGSEALKAA
jgi:rhodanese-related sulfurtransferase